MAGHASSATILVLEGDRDLLALIEPVLWRQGYFTVGLTSGQEAIAWITRNHADLMLLDLNIQDIEGNEVVQQLAKLRHAVPFIVIIRQGEERTAVDLMRAGALDYLVKDLDFLPFVPEVVRHALMNFN